MTASHPTSSSSPLAEVARVFLRLGMIAFGGPAVHVAMFEEEIVNRRRWMSRQHFLDLIGATNLIPGPNSTEMTMHCGRERAGMPGLFVAGLCFVFPAVLITGFLAAIYGRYGALPAVAPFLSGIKPAVLALVLSAIWKLGRKALKARSLYAIGALVVVAAFAGLAEVLAVLAGGALALAWHAGQGVARRGASPKSLVVGLLPLVLAASPAPLSRIFVVFLKVGAVLFGSGYVLVAYLDGELVEGLGWLTRSELLDAIAVGQFTPGPILSAATFVGYQLAGWPGAVVATAGIFLPSFFFVLLLNPLIPRLRRSAWAGAFLDGVNVGAVAVMAVVVLEMGRHVLVDPASFIVAVAGAVAVLGPRKVSPAYVVIGGALLGWLLGWL